MSDQPTPLDKSPERIASLFCEVAPRYDFLNHFLSLSLDRSWRRLAARDLFKSLARDGSVLTSPVLDVATGTGDLLMTLIKESRRRKFQFVTDKSGPTVTTFDGTTRGVDERPFVGLDFSSGMLEIAAKKIQRSGLEEQTTFLQADATAMPFANDTFAAATVAFGVRNMANLDQGLAELVRVVRPGGYVGILEFTMPRGWFFGPVYRFYFKHVLPRLGRLFSTNRQNAYRYLYESVAAFDDRETLAARMRHAGLVDVSAQPLTFGTVAWYKGRKIS
ncbi:MAG: ubiquinone/menaquinone biosynthesis methyltransferase [Planctomycetia bacterium]|nr:ubiquinone/menaquinone biosynthesis methyltransferase [Planctomycetia bacterium]